jgi:hypothetical protein
MVVSVGQLFFFSNFVSVFSLFNFKSKTRDLIDECLLQYNQSSS